MIGTTLKGRYNLTSEIGRGGMGIVYKAIDLELGREVAIKVLNPGLSHDFHFLERFRREVRSTARLEHPNIAQVYDVCEDNGVHFYVMQLIKGVDLRELINRYRQNFSLTEIHSLVLQISSALDYAHKKGVIHRDVKPENILIDENGVALIVDFGVAWAAEGSNLTVGMIGTPEYMSPEQFRGDTPNPAIDQYSLGLVAYEMLAGRTPFRTESGSTASLMHGHVYLHPPDPAQFRHDLPPNVSLALFKALEKDPARRFSSCGEFAAAFTCQSEITASVTETVIGFSPKIMAVMLIVIGVAGFGFTLFRGCGDRASSSGHEQGQIIIPLPDDLPVRFIDTGSNIDGSQPGADPDPLLAGAIIGPDEMTQNSTDRFTIAVEDMEGISFEWYCIPPDAGLFSGIDQPLADFTLVTVPAGGTVTVAVRVISENGESIVRSHDVLCVSQPEPLTRDTHHEEPLDDETGIRQLIADWEAATENKSIEALRAMYTNTLRQYYTQNNVSLDDVMVSKDSSFMRYTSLLFEISNVQVDVHDISAKAVFNKYYYFTGINEDDFTGDVVTALEFKYSGNRWLITAEYDVDPSLIGN